MWNLSVDHVEYLILRSLLIKYMDHIARDIYDLNDSHLSLSIVLDLQVSLACFVWFFFDKLVYFVDVVSSYDFI